MLPVAAVRESVIETVLPGLAFVRLPSIRAIPEQRLFFSVLQLLQHLAVMTLGEHDTFLTICLMQVSL